MNPGDHSRLIGTVIDGRYQVLQCIGEGGMGVVYKARQTSIDRMVAIKMLSSHLAQDKTWVQRFYNEGKACSRLHHPNTIRMFDFGQTTDGQLFMAMEFLDGHSLRQVISSQAPLNPLRVLKVLVQCCASLSEAHNLGIIHRDIKADNVFLIDLPGSRDHVKLLDFGVAKLMQAEDFATQVGVVFGTPQYMSPEQGRGEPLSPRSDLYGVGILAYEMLTGGVPFSDPNPMTVIQMHLQSRVPALPERVPQAVRELIMHALEKDPNRRFQSAAAMMEQCQSVLAALSTGPFRLSSSPGAPAAHGSGPGPVVGHGPPPPVYGGGPGAGSGGGMRPSGPAPHLLQTVLAGDQSALMGNGGGHGFGGHGHSGHGPGGGHGSHAASSVAAAAQKTVMVGQHGAPLPAHFVGPPGGAMRTVLLPDSSGIVSVAGGGASQAGRAPSGEMQHLDRRAHGGPRGSGASALFWIFCLLTGLAVGVGAYWLVLELGT